MTTARTRTMATVDPATITAGIIRACPCRPEATPFVALRLHARRGWSSTDPDSYSHYKRGRERQRKQAQRGVRKPTAPLSWTARRYSAGVSTKNAMRPRT
jgi:hypothetical protein